jgi:DNA-3-methyladenine glycosylase II
MRHKSLTHLSRIDPVMRGLIGVIGPCRIELQSECAPFQALARAIAHQQLHGNAARAILARFAATCGGGSFPAPRAVLASKDAELRAIGFSFSKIAALKDLAAKTLEGIVPERHELERLDDAEIIERLTQVRGIGRWTVEMMLMFHLGRPDVLPVDDFGVRMGFRLAYALRKMPKPRALYAYGERWGPFRSTAAWYLWRAVELKRAGTLPQPEERIRLPRIARRKARGKPRKKSQ